MELIMKYLFSCLFLSLLSFKSFGPVKAINFNSCIQSQINFLISEGYSARWAIKKVLVENNILPQDREYISIIED